MTHVGPIGGLAHVGPGVGTIPHGNIGSVHPGPVAGIKVVTPGGQTFTHGGPQGVIAPSGYRGGVAYGAGNVRGGPAYRTNYFSPAYLRTWGGNIRGYNYNYFTPNWYAGRTGYWNAARWASANYWAVVNYATLAAYASSVAIPIDYGYGSNVVFIDDSVYIDGTVVGTAQNYAAQAAALAEAGRAAQIDPTAEWQPIGVFGLVEGDEKVAERIFQLAIDKNGDLRGNYYDAVGDSTQQIYGSIDKKTGRAAWSIGVKKDIVFEAGLNNLTQTETTCLVHYGKDRTEQKVLVRLEQPTGAVPAGK